MSAPLVYLRTEAIRCLTGLGELRVVVWTKVLSSLCLPHAHTPVWQSHLDTIAFVLGKAKLFTRPLIFSDL
jgi:hypothetical protein